MKNQTRPKSSASVAPPRDDLIISSGGCPAGALVDGDDAKRNGVGVVAARVPGHGVRPPVRTETACVHDRIASYLRTQVLPAVLPRGSESPYSTSAATLPPVERRIRLRCVPEICFAAPSTRGTLAPPGARAPVRSGPPSIQFHSVYRSCLQN